MPEVTKEEIKKTLSKVISILSLFAKFTPTKSDDKILEVLSDLSQQEGFLELLETIIDLFDQGKKEEVANMVMGFNASR